MPTTKEELLAMSIAELAEKFSWSKLVVRGILGYRYHKNINVEEMIQKETLNNLVDDLKRDYLETLTAGPIGRTVSYEGFYYGNRSLISKLVELGFTKIDFVFLPKNTVTVELLKQVPRNELLNKDARVLGTVGVAYHSYTYDSTNDTETISYPTVAELLTKSLHHLNRDKKTIALLNELGLTQEDAPPTSSEAKNKLIGEVMTSENISVNMATQIVEVAIKRGWVTI